MNRKLFPKGEFLEELFEWVLLFLPRFYLFYGLEFLTPYALSLYCGGWVVVVVVVVGRISREKSLVFFKYNLNSLRPRMHTPA